MEIFRYALPLPDPVVTMQFTDRGGRKSQLVVLPIHVGLAPQQTAPERFANQRIYAMHTTFGSGDETKNTLATPDDGPIPKDGPKS